MYQTAGDREMATMIVSYLEEHPQASDTLEGIAGWWIMRQRVRAEVESLTRVLHELTERGVLEVSGEAGNPRYRLRTRRE